MTIVIHIGKLFAWRVRQETADTIVAPKQAVRGEIIQRRHFDPMTPTQKKISTIWGMIEDLRRAVVLLYSDIALESEGRGGSQFPLLAEALTSRRFKLQETINTLERRLAALRSTMTIAAF